MVPLGIVFFPRRYELIIFYDNPYFVKYWKFVRTEHFVDLTVIETVWKKCFIINSFTLIAMTVAMDRHLYPYDIS